MPTGSASRCTHSESREKMVKLPQPLFDVPSTQRKATAKKKRKKSRAKAVDCALFGEFSHESHESSDDDGVDVERPEHPATEEEPFDAVWEFARQAAMPGAIVYSNVEGVREQCERLGIEARYAGEERDEEEADLDLATLDGHQKGEERSSC
jgi:hypothetical protein